MCERWFFLFNNSVGTLVVLFIVFTLSPTRADKYFFPEVNESFVMDGFENSSPKRNFHKNPFSKEVICLIDLISANSNSGQTKFVVDTEVQDKTVGFTPLNLASFRAACAIIDSPEDRFLTTKILPPIELKPSSDGSYAYYHEVRLQPNWFRDDFDSKKDLRLCLGMSGLDFFASPGSPQSLDSHLQKIRDNLEFQVIDDYKVAVFIKNLDKLYSSITVSVVVVDESNYNTSFMNPIRRRERELATAAAIVRFVGDKGHIGSGVVLKSPPDGYLLTAEHVWRDFLEVPHESRKVLTSYTSIPAYSLQEVQSSSLPAKSDLRILKIDDDDVDFTLPEVPVERSASAIMNLAAGKEATVYTWGQQLSPQPAVQVGVVLSKITAIGDAITTPDGQWIRSLYLEQADDTGVFRKGWSGSGVIIDGKLIGLLHTGEVAGPSATTRTVSAIPPKYLGRQFKSHEPKVAIVAPDPNSEEVRELLAFGRENGVDLELMQYRPEFETFGIKRQPTIAIVGLDPPLRKGAYIFPVGSPSDESPYNAIVRMRSLKK